MSGRHPLHDFFPSTMSHFDHDTITSLSHQGSEGRYFGVIVTSMFVDESGNVNPSRLLSRLYADQYKTSYLQ